MRQGKWIFALVLVTSVTRAMASEEGPCGWIVGKLSRADLDRDVVALRDKSYFGRTLFPNTDLYLFIRGARLVEDDAGNPYYEVLLSNMSYADQIREDFQPKLEQNRMTVAARGAKSHFYTWDDHPIKFVKDPRPVTWDVNDESLFSGAHTRGDGTHFEPYPDGLKAVFADEQMMGEVLEVGLNHKSHRGLVKIPEGSDPAPLEKKLEGFPLTVDFVAVHSADPTVNAWKKNVPATVFKQINDPKSRNRERFYAIEYRTTEEMARIDNSFQASIAAGLKKAGGYNNSTLNKDGSLNQRLLNEHIAEFARASAQADRMPMRSALTSEERDINYSRRVNRADLGVAAASPYTVARRVVFASPMQIVRIAQMDWLKDRIRSIYEVEINPFD